MAQKRNNRTTTVEVKISSPLKPLTPPSDANQTYKWEVRRAVATRMNWYDIHEYEVAVGCPLTNYDRILVHLVKGISYYYVEVFCYDAK